jgi:hypothetical protein
MDLYIGKKVVSLPEFVIKCACHFYPELVTMLDKMRDTLIPTESELSNWENEQLKKAQHHVSWQREQLEKAERRLREIESWDDAQAEVEAEKAYQKALDYYKDEMVEKGYIRRRYEEMLALVIAKWPPPTPDHQKLKDFMIRELETSIKSDCECNYGPPKRLSGPEYKAQQIAQVQMNIEIYSSYKKDCMEEVKKRIRWVRALCESLTQFSSTS